MPENYEFTVGHSLPEWLQWHVKWTDIEYEQPTLDVNDIQFGIGRAYENNVIVFDFPAIKDWVISAHQSVNSWFLPNDDDISIEIKDFDVDFKMALKLDDDGYLDPIVFACDITFGSTQVTHKDWLLNILTKQLILFSEVVIENSAWALGKYMFEPLMGPVMDKFLNDYKMVIPVQSIVNGYHDTAYFTVDYKNTQSPIIEDHHVQFWINGEFNDLTSNGEGGSMLQGCTNYYPDKIQALAIPESQLAISNAAMSCIAEKIGSTTLGKLIINEKHIRDLFLNTPVVAGLPNLNQLPFTTSSLANSGMPLFKDKLGPDLPLRFDLSYRHMDVKFGEIGSQIVAQFKLCIQILYDYTEYPNLQLSSQELFFDEFDFAFDFDMRVDSKNYSPDVMFANIKKL